MPSLHVALTFTDRQTGEQTSVGNWLIAGPEASPHDPETLAMVAEMVHDELIDTEDAATAQHCQHL